MVKGGKRAASTPTSRAGGRLPQVLCSVGSDPGSTPSSFGGLGGLPDPLRLLGSRGRERIKCT